MEDKEYYSTDKLIYKKMAQIFKEIEPIQKNKTNNQGAGFKYRGIDDVMNSLHECFAKNDVFITSEVLSRTEVERQSKTGGALFYVTAKIKFNFFTTDGSCVSSIINGTAMDSGDKADNKCLSIALKYALLQAFLIPTEEMKDPDGETPPEIKPLKNDFSQKKAEIKNEVSLQKAISEILDNAFDLMLVWNGYPQFQKEKDFIAAAKMRKEADQKFNNSNDFNNLMDGGKK